MTLDEAIELEYELSCKYAQEEKNNYDAYGIYGRWADKHKQYAEWLEELKKYREMNVVHCKDCKHWGTGVAGETENIKCCEYGKYMVGANGYCVYGEKESAE